MSRSQAYCFTVNNYEGLLDWEDLQLAGATYLIYQEEIGEQGTIHLQGYIYFSTKKSMKQLCALIDGSSVRVANGSPQQNTTYCSKEEGRLGGPYVYGTMPQQVRTTSIASAASTARGDKNKKERKGEEFSRANSKKNYSAKNFYPPREKEPTCSPSKPIKMPACPKPNSGTITMPICALSQERKIYSELKIKPRNTKPTVLLLVGPSGTGKSRTAYQLAQFLGLTIYVVPPTKGGSGLRFDGYNQQDVCIIDEVDGSSFTPTFFNLLCDWYEMKVPVHGTANLQFTSPYIILCSNYLPKYWWKSRSRDQVKQTTRRIDITIPFFRRTPQVQPAPSINLPEDLDEFGFVTVHPIKMPHYYVQPLERFPPKITDKMIFPL
ncbi:replication associated protein [Lake Sarah-associated circular virus-31]|uniref:replication associated protein n=1 Tax=Lake Sarah-associated circular virus-31 TaxID=1685759 RepID=UPI000776FD7F|nr:replication associated protein [Lake Sarah-associated circular virus-31]ALE29711.1 replication associated protein [Lake Sarah-associated circular virus-31]